MKIQSSQKKILKLILNGGTCSAANTFVNYMMIIILRKKVGPIDIVDALISPKNFCFSCN